MSTLGTATLIAAITFSVALMVARFGVHRRVSIVGAIFVTATIQYAVLAVPYGLGMVGADQLQVPLSDDFPWFIAATFVSFAVGAWAASSLFRFDLAKEHARFFQAPVEGGTSQPDRVVFLALLVPTLLVGVLYVTSAGRTGIEALMADARDPRMLKQFRTDFAGANPYAYSGTLVNNLFAPILLLTALNVGRATGRLMWRATALCLFILLVFTSTAALNKAPIALVFLLLILNWYFSQEPGKGRRVWILALALVMSVGLVMGGYYVTYDVARGEALEATFTRLMIIPLVCVQGFLYVYPSIIDFNYGLGVGLVARIAGVTDYVSPPVAVGEIISGRNVCADAIWSTELWAAFGYPGVIIGGFLVGAGLVWADRHCLSKPRGPTSVALYAFMVVTGVRLPEFSIFTALLSGGLGLAIPLVTLLEGFLFRHPVDQPGRIPARR